MTERFRLWWAERAPRERRLLIVMFALLALVIGWLLIVRPLGNALEDARLRHDAAVEALANAKAQAVLAGRAPVSATPPLPIDSLLARTAADSGFANARITTQSPQQASVIIDAGRPQALFGWVGQLEGQGVVVDSLRARVNQDRTIYVEAAFRAGGGQ